MRKAIYGQGLPVLDKKLVVPLLQSVSEITLTGKLFLDPVLLMRECSEAGLGDLGGCHAVSSVLLLNAGLILCWLFMLIVPFLIRSGSPCM